MITLFNAPLLEGLFFCVKQKIQPVSVGLLFSNS